MYFRGYQERIVGSRSKVRLLRVLFRFPDSDFTGEDLGRKAGVSKPMTHQALSELMEENLVARRIAGSSEADLAHLRGITSTGSRGNDPPDSGPFVRGLARTSSNHTPIGEPTRLRLQAHDSREAPNRVGRCRSPSHDLALDSPLSGEGEHP